MTDIESVVKGLNDIGAFIAGRLGYEQARNYFKTIDDAIAMLREQEPRVMTMDELKEIYVEFKGDNCPIRLTNFDLQKIIMHIDDGICRLWMGKPTDGQRQAVKWDD